MKTKFITTLGLLLLFAAMVYTAQQTESAEAGQTVGADLVYTPADLPQGMFENLTTAGNGLVLSGTAVTGRYLSPILDAPMPFSALVPQWQADMPEGGSFTIQVRTATADNQWQDWVQIVENEDWTLPEETKVVGQMITVSAAEQTHQKFQFALSFGRYEATLSPTLREIRFSFIDASQGPGTAELAALQAAADQGNSPSEGGGYPKPPVIGRSLWCTDPACNYTDGLAYYPVSHLILHHTVSSNTSADWAAVVRAIWYYHTFTLEWGDIGYQYLADMNGNIYEGHLGGDDVVGIHSSGANTGSMALSLIGTFTDPEDDPPGITPPPAMMNAAADLFAWKADQKNIDVYGAGMLPNMNWGLPYISGHRDVYGGTACPGNQAHDLLPWLRDEVADRIDFITLYQYTDELTPAFSQSTGSWNVPPAGCGFNLHAYYAWSITDPGSGLMWGEWRPEVVFPGTYQIQTYAPYCITGAPETDGATYAVTHQNGTSNVTVSHNDNVGNWMSLGNFELAVGNSNLIRLTNLTTTDENKGVWFDAIRLLPLDVASASNMSPPPNSWQPRTVNFSWEVTDQVAINTTHLQVATDSDFGELLLDVNLPPTITSYSHNFGQDYPNLYWRVVVITPQNAAAASIPTKFGIDTTAPTSLMTAIHRLEDGRYKLFWFGSDITSGITAYSIQYRAEGTSTWLTLLPATAQTNAFFDPPDNQTYWFRSRATDLAGNVEPLHPNPGDLSTDQAVFLTHAIILPVIMKR